MITRPIEVQTSVYVIFAIDHMRAVHDLERSVIHSSLNQQHIFAMSAPNAHHEIAQTRYSILQQRAQAFCGAFLDLANNPPDKILSEHFTPGNPKITEHGPEWYIPN